MDDSFDDLSSKHGPKHEEVDAQEHSTFGQSEFKSQLPFPNRGSHHDKQNQKHPNGYSCHSEAFVCCKFLQSFFNFLIGCQISVEDSDEVVGHMRKSRLEVGYWIRMQSALQRWGERSRKDEG